MYFPSKKDRWLQISFWTISLLGIFIPFLNGQFTASFIMLFLVVILLWFWFKTGYRIEGNQLTVYYGPIKQRIPIHDIQIIVKSKMPINSPALSFDRIQINCTNKYDQVTISPKDQEIFINMLLKINPEIAMDKRLQR